MALQVRYHLLLGFLVEVTCLSSSERSGRVAGDGVPCSALQTLISNETTNNAGLTHLAILQHEAQGNLTGANSFRSGRKGTGLVEFRM